MHHSAGRLEPRQRAQGALGGHAEPGDHFVEHERNVRARVAGDEIVERLRDGIGERDRQTGGDREAERVA